MQITELKNGDLLLQVGNETRKQLKEDLYDKDYRSIWYELFEDYSCDGSYSPFSADEIGALSEAPCISSEQLYYNEKTYELEEPKEYWYFPNYMVTGELEELKNTGRVIFDKVNLN